MTALLSTLLFSAVAFIFSVALIPVIVARLPEDYFLHAVRRRRKKAASHFTLRQLVCNLVGLLLLAAGILMLFLPGQGVLTIILGLLLVSFPGKQRLLYTLLTRKASRKSLNWLRRKTARPPFRWPPNCRSESD